MKSHMTYATSHDIIDSCSTSVIRINCSWSLNFFIETTSTVTAEVTTVGIAVQTGKYFLTKLANFSYWLSTKWDGDVNR